MPPRKRLRSVDPDETAVRVPPKSITEAAANGTTRELLAAMRDRLAVALQDPNCAARDLASNSKRLMEVVRDIEAIDAREEQEATRRDDARDGTFNSTAI